jgi:hypothetical protein
MPNRDSTGPEGKGPLTGRGAGPCGDARDAGSQQQEFERMVGTTDFASDQYGGTEFAIEKDKGYPKRTDSTDKEYYRT